MGERRNRGELESSVLRILWDAAVPLSAREIIEAFPAQQKAPALTTVLTVLDRLVKKATVARTPAGASGWLFAASTNEPAYTAEAMSTVLLASGDRHAALLRFAGTLDSRDVELLRSALDAED